jgi:hypothetical protein
MSEISYTDRYKVDLPEGTSGDWSIEHFTVGNQDAAWENLRSMVSGSGRGVPEGTYTMLKCGGQTIMSDTPDEIRDHMGAIAEAERRGGHVLINGLGLGMVAATILNAELHCEECNGYPHRGGCTCQPVACSCDGYDEENCPTPRGVPVAAKRYAVDKVTVIENSPDVIALVGPTLTERYGDRLEIIEADAFTYKPPKGIRYSVVWHDIWPDLCEDNLKTMGTLHRRYGKRCDWQGSWGKELLQYHRRRDRANYCCCGTRKGFCGC